MATASLIGLLALPSLAAAQPVVVSAAPDKVAVTVYRDPNGSGGMNLRWLNGFALISETRPVDLPAGESELRFEGVAGGLIPQSAVVSGLGDSVREKNCDAKLLSPGTLLDASLGERVTLKRTSKATGKTVEQQAIIRAATNGMVIETEAGIETLRCDGETETLMAHQLPATLVGQAHAVDADSRGPALPRAGDADLSQQQFRLARPLCRDAWRRRQDAQPVRLADAGQWR